MGVERDCEFSVVLGSGSPIDSPFDTPAEGGTSFPADCDCEMAKGRGDAERAARGDETLLSCGSNCPADSDSEMPTVPGDTDYCARSDEAPLDRDVGIPCRDGDIPLEPGCRLPLRRRGESSLDPGGDGVDSSLDCDCERGMPSDRRCAIVIRRYECGLLCPQMA